MQQTSLFIFMNNILRICSVNLHRSESNEFRLLMRFLIPRDCLCLNSLLSFCPWVRGCRNSVQAQTIILSFIIKLFIVHNTPQHVSKMMFYFMRQIWHDLLCFFRWVYQLVLAILKRLLQVHTRIKSQMQHMQLYPLTLTHLGIIKCYLETIRRLQY